MTSIRRRSRVSSIATPPPNFYEDIFDVSKYNLNKELDRKKSFTENGWTGIVNAEDLALIGFYYLKRPDFVRCQFCNVTLGHFEINDTALREHQNFSPNCPLLKKRVTDNVPIDQAVLDELLPTPVEDEYGTRRRPSRIEQNEISHPEYRLLQERTKSFKMWPVGLKQKPQELADAGFFYSGQSDLVICFSCGLFLCQWRPDDNVWLEHKQHATRECSYLNLNHETVKLNEQKYEEVKKLNPNECGANSEASVQKTEAEPEKENSNYESLCKVCLEKRSNVILMPCRHVAVCSSCVFGLNDKCPICRAEVKEKINLFYA
jgi:baculoviral IAP repeat-containing protein 7/8